MDSASAVTAAVAWPAGFSHRGLGFTTNFAIPSARNISTSRWKERPLLNVSKIASTVSPCRAAGLALAISDVVEEVDVSKVVPQADRVLVRLEALPEQSSGGVLLPKSAVKFEHYLCGEVLSVGKEVSGVNAGQKVLFSDLNAYEANLGTKERVCFVKVGDLLALVE